MKTKIMIGTSLFLAGMSFAQPQTKPNEIVETRDYVTAVINRMSGTVPGKYTLSADYAVVGPEFEKKKNEALAQFKLTLDLLAQGGLANTIDQYNTLVGDTTLSETEKKSRLHAQLESLRQQAKTAESVYQTALRALYFIEPIIRVKVEKEITNHQLNARSDETSTEVRFNDGSRYKRKWSWQFLEYATDWEEKALEYSEAAIYAQIKKVLMKKCKISGFKYSSQYCNSSVLADLSAYYNDVDTQINRTLYISLADGNWVTLNRLEDSEIKLTLQKMSAFKFDDDYNQLPIKN